MDTIEFIEKFDIDYDSFISYNGDNIKEYKYFLLKKANGTKRDILSPSPLLLIIQKKVKVFLDTLYKAPSCVHGYVPGKSIVTNAQPHTRKKFIFKVDIKDFFMTITKKRVDGLFFSLTNDKLLSEVLSNIVTAHGYLPVGAPTSPVISNMIMFKFDKEMIRLCKSENVCYTRYADDMTFSIYKGNFPSSIGILDAKELIKPGKTLKAIISKAGFTLNENKTRSYTKHQRQSVTGLVVNKKVRPPNGYLSNLRAIKHSIEKYGIVSASQYFSELSCTETRYQNRINYYEYFGHFVRGKIEYLGMVCGKKSRIYLEYKDWYDLRFYNVGNLSRSVFPLEWFIEDSNTINGQHLALDDSMAQGTCFLLDGVGFVTADHVLPKTETFDFLKSNNILKLVDVDSGGKIDMRIAHRFPEVDLAILSPVNRDINHFGRLAFDLTFNHKVGSEVSMVGYPDYQQGNRFANHHSYITQIRTISSVVYVDVYDGIRGGMSGGPVLNMDNKVVGVMHKGDTGQNDFKKYLYVPIESVVKRCPHVPQNDQD
jgi:retron-type reverse transcriptase